MGREMDVEQWIYHPPIRWFKASLRKGRKIVWIHGDAEGIREIVEALAVKTHLGKALSAIERKDENGN